MTQDFKFKNRRGETLAGRLESPGDAPRAIALMAHCFSGTKDLPAESRLSHALCSQGIAFFRFDFTGLGESSGDFSNTNFTTNVEDIIAAADFLRTSLQAPRILIGHSLGGSAVLKAAHDIEEILAVATIGSPSDPHHVLHLFDQSLERIQEEGQATVSIGGRKFQIKRQFLEDISQQHLKDEIQGLNRALLIFHSPTDKIVGIEEARKIYEAAKHPKSFISLDGADHLLTKKEDADYVAVTLAAWASRYLKAA